MHTCWNLDLHVCEYLFHRILHAVLEVLEKYGIILISTRCSQNGVDQCRHVLKCLCELSNFGIGRVIWLEVLPLWQRTFEQMSWVGGLWGANADY